MKTTTSAPFFMRPLPRRRRPGLQGAFRIIVLSLIIVLSAFSSWPPHAWPETSLMRELEELCSKTPDNASLSVEELRALINRCDRLKLIIEKREEPERKVSLKRLRMCKDLFVFILESKKEGAGGETIRP